MKISIFGLGYVGTVGLGCLAKTGHIMIGVDLNETKVAFINQGKSPIVEPEIETILSEQQRLGRISATTDVKKAVLETDVSFICAGTPSTLQGHLNFDAIFRVAADIGRVLAEKTSFHVVAIRSTVVPGTNEKVGQLIEKASGKKYGEDFGVASNPEFLREGCAVSDYFNPPFTLIGASCDKTIEMMKKVYEGINAPIITTEIRIAEILKYVNNSFHALKIVFANEVGNICNALAIDAHKLMEVFCQDTKLNISSKYLKAGFAYGGSCLPKDLKALCTIAHDHYLQCPVLENIDRSNESHKNIVLERIIAYGKRKIGFLGLSFKAGTDDLRSSPIVDIIEKLLGKGYDIKIFDSNVHFAVLMGGNKEYIQQKIPFISQFVSDDPQVVLDGREVVVIVNKDDSFVPVLKRLPRTTFVLDLVNLPYDGRDSLKNYSGIAW